MAAQDHGSNATPAIVDDREISNDRDSETTDNVHYSTYGNMSHESPVSEDSVAPQKHGVTVSEGCTPDFAGSDDPSSQSHGSSLKYKALQFKACRRLVSALTDRDPEEKRDFPQTNRRSRPWRTTLIRFGPLSGIFSMLLAIASLVASFGILAGSDKQATPSWSVPPSTYLAIFTALANLSMRYAAIQGVVIAWWYRARKGSTVSKLHWDWHAGTTLRGALTAGRHMGMLGLACIFSTVVVIDGPLLQRSTSVVPALYTNKPVPLSFTMAPEIPHGFSGSWYTNSPYGWAWAFNDTIPTPHGSASNYVWAGHDFTMGSFVSKPWIDDSPFQGIVRGCPGVCKVKLKAPALFATTCTSHQRDNDFHHAYETKGMLTNAFAAPPEDYALIIAPNLVIGDKETLNLVIGTWTGQNCSGVLSTTICTLEAGIGEYNFTVHSDGSAVMDPQSALLPDFVAFANNTAVDRSLDPQSRSHLSTLGGVMEMVYNQHSAIVFYYGGGDSPISAMQSVFPVEDYMSRDTVDDTCPSFGRDPKDDILRAFNKLMVRMGAYAATLPLSQIQDKMDPGLVVSSTLTGYLVGPHNVFHSDYRFFIGAAVVELICIALVVPTYWGWWKLGRPVSFSPLEMAKVFEAPLLAEYNSNSSARDLANATAGFSIQYGATASDSKADGLKLAFADPASISPPQRGSRYDNH